MIAMSRLEINIRRLLTRCELMAKEDPQNNWRLEKYILALDDFIKKLQMMPNKPSKEIVMEYQRRVDFLKDVVGTTKLSNPVERVAAAQLLSKSPAPTTNTTSINVAMQIHQKTAAKYTKELRAELFANDRASSGDGLRQRYSSSNGPDDNLDVILKYNRNIQEKIAENMLSLISNMKEHAITASTVIRNDINSLDKSEKLTDINTDKLKTESIKLEEHTKSTWRCWVWVMVAFVLVVFFNMVLFMKVAKKKIQ